MFILGKLKLDFLTEKNLTGTLIKVIRNRLESAGLINSGIYEKKLINKFSNESKSKFYTKPIAFSKNNKLNENNDYEPPIKKNDTEDFSDDTYRLGFAIAQINKMFIIAQTKNKLIVVDQHAAHERIVLEKLKSAYLKNKIDKQVLLMPEILEVEGNIKLFLDNKDKIQKIGIIFEEYGDNSILVGSYQEF